MTEAPVLILRTTGIKKCREEDEKRACFHCGVDLCLTEQRREYLRDRVRFACIGCLGAIPQGAEILGPRQFSFAELSSRSGVSLREEEPVVEAVKNGAEPRFGGAALEDVTRMVATKRTCAVEDCGDKTLAKGLCGSHYHRVRRLVVAGKGSWDDKAFVAAALVQGEEKEAAPVAEKKRAKREKPRIATITVTKNEDDLATVESIVRANGKTTELPLDVAMLLALAELEPAARTRVLSWANSRWGGV